MLEEENKMNEDNINNNSTTKMPGKIKPGSKKIISQKKNSYKDKTNKTIKGQRPTQELDTVSNKSNLTNKTMSTIPNKMKDNAIEGMNIRLSKLKYEKKISLLEKSLLEKNKIIAKELKEKESLARYIKKLEDDLDKKAKMITEPYDPNTIKIKDNKEKKDILKSTSKKNTISKNTLNAFTLTCKKMRKEDTKSEADDKTERVTIKMAGMVPKLSMEDSNNGKKSIIKNKIDLMKLLYKIFMENKTLKNFQNQVYNLSQNHDEINNILSESITGFDNVAKSTGNQELINEVEQKLEEIKKKMETLLEDKQKDYLTQMEKKENDLKFIQAAYDNVKKDYEEKKSDETQEQKIIKGLKEQIENLELKLSRLQKDKDKKEEDMNKTKTKVKK